MKNNEFLNLMLKYLYIIFNQRSKIRAILLHIIMRYILLNVINYSLVENSSV